ncbi:unnamed protein product [Cuscuta campestris]|uniref:Uncharacterized protein n=1 Tax=Cuscuta campestris TaxID=132261 RepID=A0A484NPK4_9ASTE|nr:unnamed protein product [Cuscuta campestris]
MAQFIEIAHQELGPSKIRSSELALMRDLLGVPFKIHHPEAFGGISLTHNPAPERFMFEIAIVNGQGLFVKNLAGCFDEVQEAGT